VIDHRDVAGPCPRDDLAARRSTPACARAGSTTGATPVRTWTWTLPSGRHWPSLAGRAFESARPCVLASRRRVAHDYGGRATQVGGWPAVRTEGLRGMSRRSPGAPRG
jgi:hypothetical protein